MIKFTEKGILNTSWTALDQKTKKKKRKRKMTRSKH